MHAEELRERYIAGERDFSGIDIRNADLNSICLSNANLPCAKIINCNLNRANLKSANLSDADLSGSTLCHANLQEAHLRNAILKETDLNDAELLGADLTGANIIEAFNVSSPHLLIVDEDENSEPELFKVIREASRGLYNSHNSESSYPYDVFLWDVASRGNFTLEKFLEEIGLLVEVQPFDFIEDKFPVKEYGILIKKIDTYLTNYKYYFLKVGLVWLDNYVPLLIGNTLVGSWIGICPTFDIERYGKECHGRIEDSASLNDNSELLSVLEEVKANINFSKRWDYSLEHCTYEIAEIRAALLHNILIYSNIMIFEQEIESGFFGENDEYNDARYAQRIQIFSDLVRSNLKNIRVYLLSYIEIYVYLVGQTENGDWIGIHTKWTQT